MPDLPDKCAPLFQPYRYKILHGGRGGAKSWSVASALVIQGAQRRLRVLCCREIQSSIKDSVHRLLKMQIERLGLMPFYDVGEAQITGANGTEFLFEGLRYNATKIMSYEGIDIAWAEQAERISKSSWEVLIPTVRKDDSEIWITLNPDLEEDETYQRFIARPPENSVVIEMGWRDNPWFPKVLLQEMESLKKRDPDAWLHVWEGKCRHALEGAIYGIELRDAAADNRITDVPLISGHPVHTAWDVGHADSTAIWMFQRIGFEFHLIDYYESNARKIGDYQRVLQERGYIYGRHYLPHDAENEMMVGNSIADEMREWARGDIIVVPKTNDLINDINLTRNVFTQCWIDKTKCADGISCLRHYHYSVDENSGRRSKLPVHDWSSHGADAFRTFAVGFQPERRRPRERAYREAYTTEEASESWLGI